MRTAIEPAGCQGSGAPEPLEHVPCALCGADWPAALFDKDGFAIVRCTGCGLAYVSPRPPAPRVLDRYQDEHYYRNENACAFGYGDYVADTPLLNSIFARRLNEIERLRPRRGRLLDVGCATGVLVELADRRGWKAEGIEVSAFAVSRCRARGLRVHHGEIGNVPLPERAFDVIVMDDTIEHLTDPRAAMARSYELLAPGGLLTMNTPNEAGWLRFLMRRHWFHYKPLEHLYFFTPVSLSRLLEETGFRVLYSRRSAKVVTLAYLCGRARAYSRLVSRALEATIARLSLARREFELPIGEFAIFAERPY